MLPKGFNAKLWLIVGAHGVLVVCSSTFYWINIFCNRFLWCLVGWYEFIHEWTFFFARAKCVVNSMLNILWLETNLGLERARRLYSDTWRDGSTFNLHGFNNLQFKFLAMITLQRLGIWKIIRCCSFLLRLSMKIIWSFQFSTYFFQR